MLSIVRIAPTETEVLYAFVMDYWRELMPHASVVQDPGRGAAYWQAHFDLTQPDAQYWWAVVKEETIGFAKNTLGQDHDGRWAQVQDLYIVPGERRKGYGAAFCRQLFARLHEQGVGRIDLNVRRDNPGARAFWEYMGFEVALYRMRRLLD